MANKVQLNAKPKYLKINKPQGKVMHLKVKNRRPFRKNEPHPQLCTISKRLGEKSPPSCTFNSNNQPRDWDVNIKWALLLPQLAVKVLMKYDIVIQEEKTTEEKPKRRETPRVETSSIEIIEPRR